MEVRDEERKWYAIYTRSRCEQKLHRSLNRSGFCSYLPLVKEKRVWSDRIKTVGVPLFPSYVFLFAHCAQLPELHYFPGFVRMVNFGGRPCEIRQEEIDLMRGIIAKGFRARPTAYCKIGDRVKIKEGPFQGWEGQVESRKGHSRVVFQFEGLQQAISVEVGMCDLEKA